MAQFKYIGAPFTMGSCTIEESKPDWYRDGREWTWSRFEAAAQRFRLVFSSAAGPEYAGYAVCLGEVAPKADEEPYEEIVQLEPTKPAPAEVFTVYLASGRTCEWPQNTPEELRVAARGDGMLDVRGPRAIPPSLFAPGTWTHCGVRLVGEPS